MKLKRRSFLTAAFAAGVPLGLSVSAYARHSAGDTSATLRFMDSRFPNLQTVLADSMPACASCLDVATLTDTHWYQLTKDGTRFESVEGYCSWQDFVVLRDIFRDKGFRLTAAETRIDLPEGNSLFAWQMTMRG